MFWWKELLVPIPKWLDSFRGFVYILLSISSGWRWTATIFGQTPPQDSWCICWFRIKSTDKLPPISDWWFGDITCPPPNDLPGYLTSTQMSLGSARLCQAPAGLSLYSEMSISLESLGRQNAGGIGGTSKASPTRNGACHPLNGCGMIAVPFPTGWFS